MADLKDLKITSFIVERQIRGDEMFHINFAYTSASGDGSCANICCKDEGMCMDYVKQLVNNTWPG